MADKKISQLDPAAALDGTELVPIVQSAATVQTTAQDIADLGGGGSVASVVAGNNIDVDATDPANPIVAVETLTLADISDITASATEVNYTDGVTSAIQTQLDAKAPIASPTFTGTVTLPVGLTGVIRADTGVVSVDSDVTDIVAAATTTAAGRVELATDAETVTGTDTVRATTPSNITAKMAAPGAIGGTTPNTITGTTITANTGLVPDADDGAYLGQAGTAFSDLFLAEGGVINWDSGDVTITQTGNVLTFAGATTRYEYDANNTPSTTDGAALGTTGLQWSDLFLAEGGVINWDNGDATLTQVGDVVTLAGADLKVTTAGNVSTSVVNTDATQTLTNKSISGSTNTITNVSLTTGVTGILPTANGGSGVLLRQQFR